MNGAVMVVSVSIVQVEVSGVPEGGVEEGHTQGVVVHVIHTHGKEGKVRVGAAGFR